MSPVNSLWFKWKSLRLPWRRSFLVGTDLSGNTYWEFKDALNAKRLRRIVKYKPGTHYADVKVSPLWHQWLRHVRPDPPSLQEQQQNVIRQVQIKHLARLADERWASKPSFLDRPQSQHPVPATNSSDATVNASQDHTAHTKEPPSSTVPGNRTERKNKVQGDRANKDPWAKAKGAPSENWQPESWTPNASRR